MKRLAYSPVLAGAWLAVALVGRGDNVTLTQSSYQEIEVKDGGTIHGIVRLSGDAPAPDELEITKNADYCGSSKPSPRLIVGENGGVQNAVVSIEGITQGKKIARDKTPVLDQRDCEYQPHISILPVGTGLEIVNSDPILHNVHGYRLGSRRRSVFNLAQPKRGQRVLIKARRFRSPGLILATCDAGHAWMSAYIVVAEHPYYALTDADGEFKLDHVPPGSYRVRMWHEGVTVIQTELEHGKPKKYHFEEPYEMVREVIVPPNGRVTIDFELTLR